MLKGRCVVHHGIQMAELRDNPWQQGARGGLVCQVGLESRTTVAPLPAFFNGLVCFGLRMAVVHRHLPARVRSKGSWNRGRRGTFRATRLTICPARRYRTVRNQVLIIMKPRT